MYSGSYYKRFRVDGTEAMAINIADSNWCDPSAPEACGYFFIASARENISVFAVRTDIRMMLYAEDKDLNTLFTFRLYLSDPTMPQDMTKLVIKADHNDNQNLNEFRLASCGKWLEYTGQEGGYLFFYMF